MRIKKLALSATNPQRTNAILASTGGSNPSLNLDFTAGQVDPRITSVRAGLGGTNFDNTGSLVMTAASTARIDNMQARQQLPTNTATTIYPPVAPNTSVASTAVPAFFGGTQVILHSRIGAGDSNCGSFPWTVAQASVPITASLWAWIPTGSTITAVALSIEGTGVSASTSAVLGTRDQWQKVVVTANSATSGSSNIVIRAATAGGIFYTTAWQMEYGSVASNYQPTTGTVVTTEQIGLLVEESRTNSIRNPRAEGSANGTPGTPPTNWTLATANTRTIVGSGTENGVPYIDVQLAGSTLETIAWLFDTTFAASVGQIWSHTAYVRLIAGSLSGITIQNAILPRDAGAVALTQGLVVITPTAAPLSSQRYAQNYTLPDATTAFVESRLRIAVPASAFNFTLRIGAPQMELCAVNPVPTSVILPAIGTPAATTRALDQNTMPVGSWFNPQAGTYYVEVIPMVVSGTGARYLDVSGATDVELLFNADLNSMSANTFSGGNNQGRVAQTTLTANVINKAAYSVNSTIRQLVLNAGTAVTSATAGRPGLLTSVGVGGGATVTAPANGWLRKIKYFPRAMQLVEMQNITT